MREIRNFYTALKQVDESEYFYRTAVFECAPVIHAQKVAVLYSLTAQVSDACWTERLPDILNKTGLQALPLYLSGARASILFYHPARLAAALRNPDAAGLLRYYGYHPEESLHAALRTLQMRYLQNGYPHEIGIFLGYPVEDVIGFILHGGKNYKCRRHWKVYGDIALSSAMFLQIDRTRQFAAAAFNRGYDPVMLAV